jgi:hypothetical protein
MTRSVRLAYRKLRHGPRYGLVIGWDVSLQAAHVLITKGLARTTAIVPGIREGYMLVATTKRQ